MLAIVDFYDYVIWQMDIKDVFLNGHIKEELYIVHPKSFIDSKYVNKVCKLQRSIFGLKQHPGVRTTVLIKLSKDLDLSKWVDDLVFIRK